MRASLRTYFIIRQRDKNNNARQTRFTGALGIKGGYEHFRIAGVQASHARRHAWRRGEVQLHRCWGWEGGGDKLLREARTAPAFFPVAKVGQGALNVDRFYLMMIFMRLSRRGGGGSVYVWYCLASHRGLLWGRGVIIE